MAEKFKMFDYSRKRTSIETFLFYISALITGCFLVAAVKYLFAITLWGENVPKYYYMFLIYAISFLYTLAIGLRIIFCKNLWKNIKAIGLFILSILLVTPLGLITGFIPIAMLMTFEPLEGK